MSDTNKFRSLRLARAWSQEQLAELSGMSVRTVQRIENGDQPSLETLSALAAVFEVSVAHLSGPNALGDGKPEESDTGLLGYTDANGVKQQINKTDVKEVSEIPH